MPYVFNKAFDLPLQVLAGEESIPIYSLTSARIYSASPTDAQKADHTYTGGDAVASSTTLKSAGRNRYRVSFIAIPDPDATSTTEREVYYVVFSVKYASGGDNFDITEPLYVYRAQAVTSTIELTAIDIFDLDAELDDLKGAAWVDKKIKVATRRVLRKLRGMGKERARLAEGDLSDAIRFLTLGYCYRDLRESEKMNSYFDEYKEIFADSPAGYDSDGDGLVDPVAESSGGSFQLMLR